MKQTIVIPAYQPDHHLPEYVRALLDNGMSQVLVVNDGSSKDCDTVFRSIEQMGGSTVVEHEHNLGKGAALKTAIQYILDHDDETDLVVTADADGQHTVRDVIRVAEQSATVKRGIVLGARDFVHPDIPARSLFGNRLTSRMFKLLFGVELADTQTGLRGIPRHEMGWMMSIRGERYDYEMNMLIHAIRENVQIREVQIETIYEDNNDRSHYQPVQDSIRIFRKIIAGYMSSRSLYVKEPESATVNE